MQWLLILLDQMILCAWLLFKGVAIRRWCSLNFAWMWWNTGSKKPAAECWETI